MADETKVETQAAAEAPAKVVEAIAETAAKVAEQSAKPVKAAAKPRPAKRQVKAAEAAVTIKPTIKPLKRRAKASRRSTRPTKARPAAAAAKQRKTTMTFDPNSIFAGLPGAAPFQTLLTEANERGQEAVKRSQKVAEELADLTRANVEALVESGRIAAEGARSIGQDVVAKSRASVEQAADAVRSLAEAKSPTEFIQLQTEFARASFDRMVNESSKLTESVVKLYGEAFQPISNRATANAERLNDLVA